MSPGGAVLLVPPPPPLGGVCANRRCRCKGLQEGILETLSDDYYAWLSHREPHRVAVAELTGAGKAVW